MLHRVASPETIGKAREVIGRQTAHMGRLLDDLLDLSRITYNRIELDLKPLDIRRVLELAYDSTRAAMDALGHEVRFELPAAPLMVLGDEVRLTQVMSNLLNNAAKFTPPGGAITVRAYGTPERVELAIIDNGVGIAPDQLEQVFDMFSQGESKVSGGTPGLGIGLAVVRKLVELHGGSVRATSEGPGQGTTLRVDLPRIDAVQAPPSPSTVPAHPGQGRLLVADDNTDAADLLAALLEADGHAVRVAYDGEAAIRLAGEWRPDLLLLDIGMPLANGLEVARWVRAQEWGRDAALVAVTGWGQDADREETAKAGFDVHLVKPVSPEEILRTIGRYLPGQRTAR
jgi:CheY-like chemotaxis protein/two-component sensor histidine kinase